MWILLKSEKVIELEINKLKNLIKNNARVFKREELKQLLPFLSLDKKFEVFEVYSSAGVFYVFGLTKNSGKQYVAHFWRLSRGYEVLKRLIGEP